MSRLAQSFRGSALAQQVAEHQRADQRHAGRKHQAGHDGADDGEQDLLALADGAELAHHDAAVLLRREHPNERRLDQRDEGHVAVGRNGDGAQNLLLSQLHGQVDARGAVRAADDADARGLLDVEGHVEAEAFGDGADPVGPDEGDEHAELRGSAQQERDRVRDEGAEIRQGAYPKEDDDGVDLVLRAEVNGPQEPKRGVFRRGQVHDAGQGQVDQQAAEGDGNEEQGLKPLADSQVEQDEGDDDHDEVARPRGGEQDREP